jgi:hypothetical protein
MANTYRKTIRGAPVPSQSLDERYGRSQQTTRRFRVIAITAAAFAALVLISWVVWAGLAGDAATLEAKDTGHTVVNDHSVSVSWSLTVDPGTPTRCAVEALNESFGIVGWKIVAVPASDQRTRVLTEALRTTELAVTGLIYRCWPA